MVKGSSSTRTRVHIKTASANHQQRGTSVNGGSEEQNPETPKSLKSKNSGASLVFHLFHTGQSKKHGSPVHMAVGQNQWYHFGVGAPPILVYFSGDWDVHSGYRILTHGHMGVCHFLRVPVSAWLKNANCNLIVGSCPPPPPPRF